MKRFFENLTDCPTIEFQEAESKWYNGHGYFPLFNYNLNYQYLSGKVEIHYEFRQSEFSKSSAIDVGSFGDRHLYEIKCEIKTSNKYPNFSVKEIGVLEKLLSANSQIKYKIKCENKELKRILEENINLKQIYNLVDNSSEFSPQIEAKSKQGYYVLKVMYNTKLKNEESIQLFNDFCKNLIEYCN